MKKILCFMMLLVSAVGVDAYGADGFYTQGTRLMDANGKEFVMRGCNYSWAWQRGHEKTVIPAAKRIGCNAIRIQLSTGRKWDRCSAYSLEKLIKLCVDNKLVVIFNTHDETGSNDYSDLDNAADFWIEMKDILNRYRKYVLVNISNEWYGGWQSDPWADGYKRVIPKLRNAGLKNTLVVDCAGWGQYPKSLFDRGRDVAAADTEHNLVFSMHFYQDAAGSDYQVRSNIDNALNVGVPVLIGEFAYEHQGHQIAWQTILDYTKEKNIGYLVWSWTGNGSGAESCDMFGGYDDSSWKPNGTNTVKGRNGIQQTSRECSVFDPNGGGTDPEDPPVGPADPTPGETVVDNPGKNIYSWDEMYHLEKSKLGTLTSADKVRLYVSCNDGAEIQVAYKTNDSDWNKYIDYAPISGSTYDLPMTDSALLTGANYDGIYFKGHDYTIQKVSVLRPGQSGIEEIILPETSRPSIDFTLPYEIYTLDGRHVVEMTSGHIYILRQGSVAVKHLAH